MCARRQPRDHAPFSREVDHAGGCSRPFASRLRCDELDALRRAGRARGVDQREHVRRAGSAATDAADVEVGVRALDLRQRERPQGRLAVDDDHVARAAAAAGAPRAPVRGTAARRSRPSRRRRLTRYSICSDVYVVYREKGVAPSIITARSQRWNSGRLPSISATRVAALHSELREPSGERVHAFAKLAPGDGELVPLGADRHIARRARRR